MYRKDRHICPLDLSHVQKDPSLSFQNSDVKYLPLTIAEAAVMMGSWSVSPRCKPGLASCKFVWSKLLSSLVGKCVYVGFRQ